MTGETDFDKGAAILRAQYPNIRLCNVMAGAQGSYSYYEGAAGLPARLHLGRRH